MLGLAATFLPAFEILFLKLFEKLGQSVFHLEGFMAVIGELIIYFPLGAFPFIFGEFAGPIFDTDAFFGIPKMLSSPPAWFIIMMLIAFFGMVNFTPDKIKNITEETKVWLENSLNVELSGSATDGKEPTFLVKGAISIYRSAIDSGKEVIAMLRGAPQAVTDFTKKQIANSLGDQYTGKVDEKAKQKIGVYLKRLESSENAEHTFATSERAIFFTNLKAETLDAPLHINLNCVASDSSNTYAATKILPKNNLTVATYEEESIDCMFDPNTLPKGDFQINLTATFPFKTLVYVKNYFIDKERLRSYREEKIDPFKQHGITDTNPVSIYTNGPLMMGMSLNREQPVTLDRSLEEQRYALGITIKNNWGTGTVTEVKDIVIIVPKGFDLDEIQAFNTSTIKCANIPKEESCDDELYNVYQIVPKKGFENEYTYRIYFKVDSSNYDIVLGATPIATHYFKAMVDYEYQLFAIKRITVYEPSSIQQGVTGPTGVTTGPVFTDIKADPGYITDTTAKITWETSTDTTGNLYYWWSGDDTLTYNMSDSTNSTKHTLDITSGLASERSYSYKITAVDEHGRTSTSDPPRTFTTKASTTVPATP